MSESIRVEIMAPNDVWMQTIDDLPQFVTKVIREAVKATNRIHNACEVCVVLSDDRELRILNKDYRGIDRPTNVLSFPGDPIDEDEGSYSIGKRPIVLGDIVVAYETVARESEEESKSITNHLAHILIHGALHLCRYDHESQKDARKMESLEVSILKELSIPNPYESSEPIFLEKNTVKKKKVIKKQSSKKGAKKNQ